MDYGFTSIFALEVVLKVILIVIKCISILLYLFQFLVESGYEIIDFKLFSILILWNFKNLLTSEKISDLFCLIIVTPISKQRWLYQLILLDHQFWSSATSWFLLQRCMELCGYVGCLLCINFNWLEVHHFFLLFTFFLRFILPWQRHLKF